MLHEDIHRHAASSRRSSKMAEGIRGATSLLRQRVAGTSIGQACRSVLIIRENMTWLPTAIANYSHINTSNPCITQGCLHCRSPGWDDSQHVAGEDSDNEGGRGHKPQDSGR